MKIKLFGLLCMLVLLGGCMEIPTEQQKYNQALQGCTMTGYKVYQDNFGNYVCKTDEYIKSMRFYDCSSSCDRAIDDNRDLTLVNSSTQTLECLNLCLKNTN